VLVQRFRDLDQLGAGNAIGALLVLLNLLKADATAAPGG
jgi:hypothetical protein